MGSSNGSKVDEEEGSSLPESPERWTLNTKVWAHRTPRRRTERLLDALQQIGSSVFIFFSGRGLVYLGGFGVLLSFLLAYSIGGTRFFGLLVYVIWGIIAVLAVLVLEKTGYARNFADHDISIRNILYSTLALAVGLGLIVFVLLLASGHLAFL